MASVCTRPVLCRWTAAGRSALGPLGRMGLEQREGGTEGGGVKVQRGPAEGSLMSTCSLQGPHYTDANGEAFRG